MNAAPFTLLEPANGESPVVVEVPHASVVVDAESMARCVAPASAIARDADLYVDELMAEAPLEGATLLCAGYSRYVLDLNREQDDVDGVAVEGGAARNRPCGLLWRASTRGDKALEGPVEPSELERRMALVYRPYHAALQRLVERKRKRFGSVVLLSAHSMPSPASDAPADAGARADMVTGTRGRTTAHVSLIALVEQHVRAFGWTVSRDDPYPGGATTHRFGKPREGVHAIQVEMARRLYMNEATLAKRPDGFDLTKSFCRGLVAKLGAAAVG